MDDREAKLAVLEDLKKTMIQEDAKKFKKEKPEEGKEKKPKKVPISIRLMQLGA